MERWFTRLDTDGSGTIEWAELLHWWQAEGAAYARAAATAASAASGRATGIMASGQNFSSGIMASGGGGVSGRGGGGGGGGGGGSCGGDGGGGGGGDAAWEAEKALLWQVRSPPISRQLALLLLPGGCDRSCDCGCDLYLTCTCTCTCACDCGCDL